MPTPVDIAPARGKLGVLLVGLGAVSTTTIAGVIAIRKGLSAPIGSLTQMGTMRLGKRTEGRSPKISDVVPLATLDDRVEHDLRLRRDPDGHPVRECRAESLGRHPRADGARRAHEVAGGRQGHE